MKSFQKANDFGTINQFRAVSSAICRILSEELMDCLAQRIWGKQGHMLDFDLCAVKRVKLWFCKYFRSRGLNL